MSGSNPAPGSQAARRGGFWTFWTTLPGILTGLAALVTAIVGLLALFNGGGGRQSNAPASGSALGLPNQGSPQTTSTSTQAAATSRLPGGVFSNGKIRMKSPDDADPKKKA
jgi:hypothetical protein